MLAVVVAINLPVKQLFKQYTYAVPQGLEYIDVGWRVVVGFHGQTVEGFVVERIANYQDADTPTEEVNLFGEVVQTKAKTIGLKYIEAVLGDRAWFDQEMLATAKWLSEYYMCNLAEAMRLFVPGKTSIKRQAVRDANGKLLYYDYQERLKERTVLAYRLTEAGRKALAEAGENIAKRAKAQYTALVTMSKYTDFLSIAELNDEHVTVAALKAMLAKQWVEEGRKRILRNSYSQLNEVGQDLQLTPEQENAVAQISTSIRNKDGQTFFVQGVTGSGKTEVYLRSAAMAVAMGKQVLMLVPEIALTAQLVKRFQAWFGNAIAVAHSKLSQNERGDVWYKMRTGQARVLIGVRSAVFAPFENLGLILIDEEHETSYKQEDRPNYHARDVALARCRNTGAPLVLGSATPDICSYFEALNGGYKHLRLTRRANGSLLPEVGIVDMRQELKERNFSVLSRPLQQELVRTVANGEQSIILLNRRGFSTFVNCRDCGQSVECPHCKVALVYHSAGEAMRCHYCGNTAPVPTICPHCGSRRIKFFGTGTQKAEQEIMALPDVRVLRMDQDSTAAKLAHLDILQKFSSGSYNTLIGTQMVAKGHDIPNVTLVGVLSADSSLNLPDYKAGERTFALLTQAAGRAGRGDKPGHVVFQTYDPENKIIKLAAKQDYDSFAKGELKYREELFYPPYAKLLKMTISSKDEGEGLAQAQKVAGYLQGLQLEGKLTDLMILGPFPALVSKVRDLYRFNILVKAKDMEAVKKALWNSEYKEMHNLVFDVDPVSVI